MDSVGIIELSDLKTKENGIDLAFIVQPNSNLDDIRSFIKNTSAMTFGERIDLAPFLESLSEDRKVKLADSIMKLGDQVMRVNTWLIHMVLQDKPRAHSRKIAQSILSYYGAQIDDDTIFNNLS